MKDLMNAVPRIHPDTGVRRIDGRLMAASPDDYMHTFEEDSGDVSDVGERTVELVNGARTVGQIVDKLCDEYEVDRETCAADTLNFVQLLIERKVLILD